MNTANEFKVVNKETGEIITINDNAGKQELSTARKVVLMQIKELEAQQEVIDAALEPYIEDAFKNDEEELCGYWKIVKGARRFDSKLFEAKAKKTVVKRREEIKSELEVIEEPFKVSGKPYLKFPKL